VNGWWGARLASVLLVLPSACSGHNPGGVTPTAQPRCEIGFSAPAGFEQVESFDELYSNRVGVRLGYRDASGRELHVFAGIPGEFGEGLPDAGEVQVTGGWPGRLLGNGSVWVLAWDTSGPCAAHAVLGNGLARRRFLRVLMESGVVPA
jgi:hypothetical protein